MTRVDTLPDEPQVDPVVPRRRWRPPIIREPLVIVLGAVGVGLWLVWVHHPRKGLAMIALALAVSALLRLVLPPRDAGLLVVRSRFVDVAVLLVLAGMVVVLAVVQHFPGPGR
jgi:Protein of unknown function (DUF3017)